MSSNKKSVLALVLAGGIGKRLYPLTRERTKPSVPFGGKYRIIDFALSNLINSGIFSIYVLVQYKSQSLIEHVRTARRKEGVLPKHFVTIVPPQMRREDIQDWYRGTADSIYQNINLIYDYKPSMVAIFGGDHIYRMNVQDMVDYHLRKKAKLTIAVNPIDARDAHHFGVVDVDNNNKVMGFREKPTLFGDQTLLASMGNYIFDTDYLIDALEANVKIDTSHDFGRDVIPNLVNDKEHKVFAYDFSESKIPSLKKGEAKYYWRDVGTISSYWESNMDLLGNQPLLDLNNPDWPIYASDLNCTPSYISNAQIENSFICEGARIDRARIKNSILGRSVTVDEDTTIEDSIILDFTHVKRSSIIKKAIIDRCNVLPAQTSIGLNREKDQAEYHIDESGIVVVGRGLRKPFYF